MISLYLLRLIEYDEISPAAWIYIFLSWFGIIFGGILASNKYIRFTGSKYVSNVPIQECVSKIGIAILILTIIALLSITYRLVSIVEYFGTVSNTVQNLSSIYHLSNSNEFKQIPYLDSFALAGAAFGGVYVSVCKKNRLIGFLPLLAVILHSLTTFSRAKVIIAFSLFFSGYMFSTTKNMNLKNVNSKKALIGGTICLSVLLLLSSTRRLTTSYGMYESQYMAIIRMIVPISPSVYVYLSSPIVVFSEVVSTHSTSSFPGQVVFAPLWRILEKFGIGPGAPYTSNFHSVPIEANASTYLRSLYVDYRLVGIILFPLSLSFTLTILMNRLEKINDILDISLISSLMIIILMSFFTNVTKLGYWVVALSLLILVSIVIKISDSLGTS